MRVDRVAEEKFVRPVIVTEFQKFVIQLEGERGPQCFQISSKIFNSLSNIWSIGADFRHSTRPGGIYKYPTDPQKFSIYEQTERGGGQCEHASSRLKSSEKKGRRDWGSAEFRRCLPFTSVPSDFGRKGGKRYQRSSQSQISLAPAAVRNGGEGRIDH